ncbi:uncharacterized protein TM35_000431070 [Trypanosoma theileri]|uniref:Mucin TcMUCII n=1 Tax=Trypanosoma theileri TaxID=67003 RepID=A0A1X0NK35_9TRYP|nr:uncharacterized protein TM35_000431070 [Trypanosoma theileri]ORC84539.1 hypothetical protein TM35_000431070 [Trypanosoma theileri]
MMMMSRVICVLAVVLCCACSSTMASGVGTALGALAPTFMDWGAPDKYKSSLGRTGQPTGTRRNNDDPTHSHRSEVENEELAKRRSEESAEEMPPEGDPFTQGSGKDGGISKHQDSSDHSRGTEAGEVERGPAAVQGEVSSAVQSGVSTLPSTGTAGTHDEEQEVKQTQSQNNGTDPATHGTEEAPINTSENTTPADSNPIQPSPEAAGATAASDSQETTSTIPPSPENTTTEAPTTTPSPVPVNDTQINTIASTVQKKANADSSINPVWIRTAASLLIVAVLVSATVY